jgi:hypothetical protein
MVITPFSLILIDDMINCCSSFCISALVISARNQNTFGFTGNLPVSNSVLVMDKTKTTNSHKACERRSFPGSTL